MVRGVIKKAAIKVIHRCYDLFAEDASFDTPDPEVVVAMRKQYTEQKVAELLGPESLYLCGRTKHVCLFAGHYSRHVTDSMVAFRVFRHHMQTPPSQNLCMHWSSAGKQTSNQSHLLTSRHSIQSRSRSWRMLLSR